MWLTSLNSLFHRSGLRLKHKKKTKQEYYETVRPEGWILIWLDSNSWFPCFKMPIFSEYKKMNTKKK